MEHSFASRVLEFRKLKGLSQQAFAERCGLEQGNVSQMEKGTEPKQSNITKLVAGFPDLSPEWLLLGTGPMLRDGRALAPVPRPEPAPDYTTAEGTGLAAVNIILKEQIADLRKQNQQLLDMLGKSPGSSDAAGLHAPAAPRPAPGFKLSSSYRAANRGRAQQSR